MCIFNLFINKFDTLKWTGKKREKKKQGKGNKEIKEVLKRLEKSTELIQFIVNEHILSPFYFTICTAHSNIGFEFLNWNLKLANKLLSLAMMS